MYPDDFTIRVHYSDHLYLSWLTHPTLYMGMKPYNINCRNTVINKGFTVYADFKKAFPTNFWTMLFNMAEEQHKVAPDKIQ